MSDFELNTKWVPQVLLDPTTKVVFYLESDRRHVAAISPDGKILWCSEIVSARGNKKRDDPGPLGIGTFRFDDPNDNVDGPKTGGGYLRVGIFGIGFGGLTGYIDKKTGKFHPGEVS